MIEKLEIHHLRTLAALYRSPSISAAAEALNVSQQAVSQQLKKIRAILNDRLFVRTGHGMTATPYARLIEPHIVEVLHQLKQIPLPDSVTPAQIQRTLVISATDYTQEVIVTDLIGALRRSAPGVRVIVEKIESVSLVTKMHRGEIDLAFTSDGYVPEGLISAPLFSEQYRCVSANPALADCHPLPLSRLPDHDFVITSPGTGSFRGSADTWLEQQGLHRNVVLSTPSFHMAQQCLRKTDLLGFMPSRLLPIEGVPEVTLEKYPPGYQVVVAYHPSTKSDPFMQWLLQQLETLLVSKQL